MEVSTRVTKIRAKDRSKMRAEILLNVEYFIANPESEYAKKIINLGAVHNKLLGLEVFYTIQFTENGRCAVTYNMLKILEISSCELERAARKNTEKNNKFILVRALDAIAFKFGFPEKAIEDTGALVLTTQKWKNGASSLLFPEMFRKAAEELASDLYVFPNSTDELIVIPQKGNEDVKELKELIRRVNKAIGSREKAALSNNVYEYCRKNEKLSIVKK